VGLAGGALIGGAPPDARTAAGTATAGWTAVRASGPAVVRRRADGAALDGAALDGAVLDCAAAAGAVDVSGVDGAVLDGADAAAASGVVGFAVVLAVAGTFSALASAVVDPSCADGSRPAAAASGPVPSGVP
jgi:hypothetical protein